MRFTCRIEITKKGDTNMRLVAEKLMSLEFDKFILNQNELLLCLDPPTVEDVIRITNELKADLMDTFENLSFNDVQVNRVERLIREREVGECFRVNQYIIV